MPAGNDRPAAASGVRVGAFAGSMSWSRTGCGIRMAVPPWAGGTAVSTSARVARRRADETREAQHHCRRPPNPHQGYQTTARSIRVD